MRKQLLVTAISLVVFFVPNVAGFGTWFLTVGSIPVVLRSLVSILAWVVAFGLSTLLFWKLVLRALPGGVAAGVEASPERPSPP